MKKNIAFLLLAFLFVNLTAIAAPQIKKSNLRILYVGGSAEREQSSFVKPEDFQQSVKERMAAFEKMLNTYFTSVTVITADKYTQQMSDNYDVTVMDGTPREIVPQYLDMNKRIYRKAGYLTEDFDKPMLTIGDMASVIGNRIGCKNDWYCHCLDADAHTWRKDHPIFKGPFEVKMTVVNKPTPEEAFHYAYSYEGEMPKELPVWKVQTKGFSSDEGFRVGLVSRPWGYEDSPEAEYISGGISSKSLDAVAIGRHGNFLLWGFAASPAYLTEEARSVLANAIVYISHFKGQGIIARKYNEGISTRETLKDLRFMASEQAYQDMVKMTDEANRMMQEESKKAKEKQARGEELSEHEKAYLNVALIPQKSREEMLSLYMPRYYKMFGTDEQAYGRYFDENRDYFYGGDGELSVDQDTKSLGIPNNDLRLIDAAIKMLESGKEAAKGRRILARYTLMDFPTAAGWRAWFEKNKKKMFFSEAGGWVFLIDSREPGVNDYKGWEIRRLQEALPTAATDENNPVTVAVSHETLQSGDQVVLVKVNIHPTYHIYARVGAGSPFIPTKLDIQLPDGYTKSGNLQLPPAKPFNQSGTMMYDGTIVFRQPVSGCGKGTISCNLSYQCCNDRICYPPTELSLPIELK